MKNNQLWMIIAGLFLINCLTVAFFLNKDGWVNKTGILSGSEEVVANIGEERITRQHWLNEMEERYGQIVLKDMIDQKVIEQLAKKYKIKISDEAIDHELRLIQTMYGTNDQMKGSNDEKWKEQIRYSLLLEELLTKDAIVTEVEMKNYFKENKNLFDVPTSYHLSHIIVKTKKEATDTLKELEQGSSFSALAMERSMEEFSANQGGDIGFISEEEDRYPNAYLNQAKKLEEGEWSQPLEVENGYAIIMLQKRLEGKKYNFNQVKGQIRRQIALEQMDTPVSASAFWNELKVDWFYGKKNE
ncbi:peptidyl-prolyl cis-trans isomerase [Bacillus sp. CGMCC 1.16607]|uniref:peptidyl-prolyl cis-trans isomerase n=1 Tax=Bacillus sp. CGMCC 1.16607 TaxID=3351842 RepID=UPI00363DA1DE